MDLPELLTALGATFPVRNKIPVVSWGRLSPGEHAPVPPDCDRAIATGHGFFVIDVDCKNGVDGFASLPSDLPDTYATESPSGGMHLYYRIPEDTKIPNKVGWKPGIDIRGTGGYVVAYPAVSDLPLANAPQWLIKDLRATPGPPPVDLTDPLLTKTSQDLAADLHGKKGAYADALRRAARGERFVRAVGSDKGPRREGGVDDFILRMLMYLAGVGDWSHVPGSHAVGEILAPAFSLLADDDARAGNDVYPLSKWIESYDKATLKIRSDYAADRALYEAIAHAEEESVHTPKILQFRNTFYLRDMVQGYAGPFTQQEVWAQARDREVFPVVKPSKSGTTRLDVPDMMEAFGKEGALTRVEQDLSLQVSELHGSALRVACCIRPHIHSEYSDRIHDWLMSLGGDSLIDWLSVLTDLAEAAPAIWLSGAKGVGKSLLARGCAQVFGRSAPISMSKAMGRFNDALAQCPIVFGDEEIPRDFRGQPQIDQLKQLVTDTARDIETKGMPVVPLRGAVRVILASNNLALLHTSRFITPDDAAAIADRFIHAEVDSRVAKIFETVDVQRDWLDGGALARHIAWILENHPRPERGRLRMKPSAEKLESILLTQTGDSFYAIRAIVWWFLGKNGVQWETPGMELRDGKIYATVEGVKKALQQIEGDRVPVADRMLGATLQKIKSASGHVRWDVLEQWAVQSGWASREELRDARK